MSYQDLLRALEDEAVREAEALRDDGRREADRVLEEARRAAADERAAALAAADAEEARAISRSRVEVERQVQRELLLAARAWLDAVRAEALGRLQGRSEELLPRLADELAGIAAPGPATFVVDPGVEERLRAHLAGRHPELATRAAIAVAPVPRGGVELVQGEVALDDTLASRVERAWLALEPRLGALVLGEDRGAV